MPVATLAALAATSAIVLALTGPADAQQRSGYRAQTERITIIDENGRARTRITVRPRSFLDPGNNVEPYSQHYTDYAMQPDSYPGEYLYDRNDWRSSWSRMPIPTCFDLPGMCR